MRSSSRKAYRIIFTSSVEELRKQSSLKNALSLSQRFGQRVHTMIPISINYLYGSLTLYPNTTINVILCVITYSRQLKSSLPPRRGCGYATRQRQRTFPRIRTSDCFFEIPLECPHEQNSTTEALSWTRTAWKFNISSSDK